MLKLRTLGTWFTKVLPSIITMMAMGSGLSAVRCAQDDDLPKAVWFLLAAAIFDGLDGHVARALGAASAFGAELDSLCDLVDFGVCPSLVLFQWCRHEGPRLASVLNISVDETAWHASQNFLWLTSLFYTACCAVRLARFNLSIEPPVPQPPHSTHFVEDIDGLGEEELVLVKGKKQTIVRRKVSQRSIISDETCPVTNEEEKEGKWLDAYINKHKFFEGVPAPMGAYLALSPLVYWFQYGYPHVMIRLETVVSLTFVTVGILMVCTMRTFSSKMLIRGPVNIRDPHTSHLRSKNIVTALMKIALVGILGTLLVTDPWRTLLAFTTIYVITLPFGQVIYSCALTDKHADHH